MTGCWFISWRWTSTSSTVKCGANTKLSTLYPDACHKYVFPMFLAVADDGPTTVWCFACFWKHRNIVNNCCFIVFHEKLCIKFPLSETWETLLCATRHPLFCEIVRWFRVFSSFQCVQFYVLTMLVSHCYLFVYHSCNIMFPQPTLFKFFGLSREIRTTDTLEYKIIKYDHRPSTYPHIVSEWKLNR